jgi:hypothetical protein
MKKEYRYLAPLFDVTTSCVNPEYMKIGIKIGNTIYIIPVPRSETIDIIYENNLIKSDEITGN